MPANALEWTATSKEVARHVANGWQKLLMKQDKHMVARTAQPLVTYRKPRNGLCIHPSLHGEQENVRDTFCWQ